MLSNCIFAALLSNAASTFDQDREAILGMCGAFEVTFQFEEMTPVQPSGVTVWVLIDSKMW